MTHPPLVSRLVTHQNCSQLRHKGMYVFTEVEADDPLQARDGLESTAYWCACTQKPFGPDGQPVSARSCTAERGCCEH
jgi:hypothetical protein